MSVPAYKWQLKVGSASYVDVNPRWEATAKHITEGEQNEMWFRTKFSGNMVFQREDYDMIVTAGFDTEFRLLLHEHDGTNWQSLSPMLRFWKTDCKFDVDGKTVEVTPEAFDNYDIILGGMDKEFNLIELEPPTTPVTFAVQPLIQVYFAGSDKLTNYLGSVWFQQDVDTTVTVQSTLQGTYHFGTKYQFAVATGEGEGLNPDVGGIYNYNSSTMEYERADGVYRMGVYTSIPNVQVGVWRVSDNVLMYAAPVSTPLPRVPADGTQGVLMTSQIDGVSKIRGFYCEVYMRLLTTLDTVGATSTFDIPSPDLLSSTGNYTKVLPITAGNFIKPSENSGTTATKWKKLPDTAQHNPGEYFTTPDSINTWYPIMPESWVDVGFWLKYDATLKAYQESGAKQVTIEHAYKLSDVISTLLQAIGTTVTHQDGAAWSDFLYSAGTNAIRGSRKVPIITPKSNVLVGEYDQPATKAPIKLGEVLRLLRSFHNCFWHISSDNKFVVEHYQYYHNGGSYTSPVIGIDTTTSLEPKTGLPWGYMTSRYTFAKQDLPERMEFGWMDRSSQPFDGYAIDIDSAYVQKGNVESKKVSLFTSDIDFLNVSPSDIVKEGFVFFEAGESGGNLTVPFVEFTLSADEEYKMQNGYTSFVWGHDKYHRHGLPASSVTLNKQAVTASSIRRTKVQEIEIAVGADIDPYKLVTTKLGTGRVDKVEKNLQSHDYKITIRHNTE